MWLIDLAFYCVMALVIYTDYLDSEIWDVHILAGFVLVALKRFMEDSLTDGLVGAGSAFIFHYLIYRCAKARYKKEAYGLGDVLLFSLVGAYLGRSFFLYQFWFSMVSGILFGCYMLIKGKDANIFMPLAPLIAAVLVFYDILGLPGWELFR